MKSAGLLKREHFTTQHVVKLCKSWPQDIMETKITNGFKSWWGNLAEDKAISFCSKLCPGWNPRSSFVSRSCERGEVPQCLHFFWFSSPEHPFPTTGPGGGLLFGVTTMRICYAFKIYDWHLFLCFSTSSITASSGRPKCVCPSQLFQMAEKQPSPHSPRIVDPGRVCWDGKGPEGLTATFLLLLILRGALEQGPCRPCHASILLPALPGLAAPGLHPVLMSKAQRERKIKPLSAAKPSSP